MPRRARVNRAAAKFLEHDLHIAIQRGLAPLFDTEYSEGRLGPMPVFCAHPANDMADPDLAIVALVLFVVIAALLFPGGPGTPRRTRVEL
jgi:hypothetical protein